MDKKEKYYSYVVDDFIKKTEIDHEKKVIKTPFTKPIFFNTNNGYNASNIINYFFFDFYDAPFISHTAAAAAPAH